MAACPQTWQRITVTEMQTQLSVAYAHCKESWRLTISTNYASLISIESLSTQVWLMVMGKNEEEEDKEEEIKFEASMQRGGKKGGQPGDRDERLLTTLGCPICSPFILWLMIQKLVDWQQLWIMNSLYTAATVALKVSRWVKPATLQIEIMASRSPFTEVLSARKWERLGALTAT